ncbi:imelysin family protein [Roseibium sp.]|uniref:imelysin family protein n=1 Tax=Roseibium sp. TaxID=1936156 RepID=UPI003BB21554
MRSLLLALAITLPALPAGAADLNTPLQAVISSYIGPATQNFATAAAKLPGAVEAVCADNSNTNQQALTAAFSETVDRFARIHFLRFGPLLEDDRLNRLSFLPDPRGIAQRQIRKVYAAKDESVLDVQSLREKSVALQSLTAFELIAFDKSANLVLGTEEKNRDFTCRYALAIAQNAAAISVAVAADWADPDGYRKLLLTGGADNPRFRSSKEAFETVYNAFTTALTIVKDQDLLPALGTSTEKAKPRRFPYSRSGNAVTYLTAELDGVRDAIFSMPLKDMMSADDQWTLDTLGFEFKNADGYLAKLQPPLRTTFGENGSYNMASALVINVGSIQDLLQGIAGALDLSGGFNALDGD